MEKQKSGIAGIYGKIWSWSENDHQCSPDGEVVIIKISKDFGVVVMS